MGEYNKFLSWNNNGKCWANIYQIYSIYHKHNRISKSKQQPTHQTYSIHVRKIVSSWAHARSGVIYMQYNGRVCGERQNRIASIQLDSNELSKLLSTERVAGKRLLEHPSAYRQQTGRVRPPVILC